jgi:hypothetical protein
MKISENHITELYKFTREHFVEHYDVQTELVDHLANDIEQTWQAQPGLTFKEARTISFKKFGVFGFMDVVEARQKALEKRYWQIIVQFAKEWFQLPKIILTFMSCFILYQLFTSHASENIFIAILLGYLLACIIKIFQLKVVFKKQTKKTGRKWMLEDLIFKQGAGFATILPLYTLQIFSHINGITSMSMFWALMLAAFYTAVFIIGYVSLVIVPKKAKELLEETYPEYKML